MSSRKPSAPDTPAADDSSQRVPPAKARNAERFDRQARALRENLRRRRQQRRSGDDDSGDPPEG